MTRLLAIAFRNLLRARRRNALAGGTMVLGSAALVLGSGLVDGISRQLTRSLVAVQTGHLVVLARPDDFVPQNSPFDAYGQDPIPGGEALAGAIEAAGQRSGVVRALPLYSGRVTAMAGSRSSPGTIVGVDPARDVDLRGAFPLEEGTFLPTGDDTAVYVAAPVARKLRLSVGDSVSFVVQTPQGAVNSLDGIVCGVFRKSAPWYDATFFVSIRSAQSLFDSPGMATSVKVFLADGSVDGARQARAVVAAAVGRPEGLEKGQRVRVETLDEAGRFCFSIIQANRVALAILSSFLFAASAVGIVNAMLMSVHERTREIGTVRALGMRRRVVVRLFLFEGLALGVVSAVLGCLLGSAGVLYFGSRGIAMNTMTLAWMAGGDHLFPVLTLWNVARAALAILGLSAVAAVYPAVAASRLEPREALHHV